MQSPLDSDDYSNGNKVRLYKMDITSATHTEYLYQIDAPHTFVKDNESKTRKQKDVKISEMVSIADDELLVLERVSSTTKFFKINLKNATPISAENSTSLVGTTVVKSKVFDSDLVDGLANKIEGIAPLGNNQYALINDNDFGIGGDDTKIAIVEFDANNVITEKKQLPGIVAFFDVDGNHTKSVNVGVLPDMVKFTHDGKKVLVVNEGELVGNEELDAPLYNPLGTVSIIDMTDEYKTTTINFNSITEAPLGSKVRKGTTMSRDFEPEYISVNEDNTFAWISLQESNAIAKINLSNNSLETIFGLGFKDFSLTENALDFKNDGLVNIETTPKGVYGMYQPDTIAVYQVDGKDYIVTANEGDDRDDFYSETTKASKLSHTAIGDIGNLRVNPDLGDNNNDGEYEELYAYGTRSFSIFDGDTGALVFDSANDFETTVAAQISDDYFATRPKKGKWYATDERSEKKSIEPEALTLSKIRDKTFAYIGLEKQGGFFVYDITNPNAPTFVEYNNDIDYTKSFDPDTESTPVDIDDMAPEGSVTFTQNDKNYYVLSNEVSGTVSIYELSNDGKASKKSTYRSGIYNDSACEIVDYDSGTKRLFVTSAALNAIIVLDVSNVDNINKVNQIDLSTYGDGVNSLSVHNGLLAVAIERVEK
jgi:hypothetical protein